MNTIDKARTIVMVTCGLPEKPTEGDGYWERVLAVSNSKNLDADYKMAQLIRLSMSMQRQGSGDEHS